MSDLESLSMKSTATQLVTRDFIYLNWHRGSVFDRVP